MKNKKKTRNKNQRQNIEELIEGKPWGYIVEEMPGSVQRLACMALEAYDKDDWRRMEKTLEQIREGDTARLRLLLVRLYENVKHNDKAVGILEDLIEECADDGRKDGAFDEINMENILDIPSGFRKEIYRLMQGAAYIRMGKAERAAEVIGGVFPLKRKCARAYQNYMLALWEAEQYEKCREVAWELADLVKNGRYGEDYYYQYINLGFKLSEEDIVGKMQTAKEEGRNGNDAAAFLEAYQLIFDCGIRLGLPEDIDRALSDIYGYVHGLDEELKYSPGFMQSIGTIIVDMSSQTEDERWREPFKKLLDMVDESGFFHKESSKAWYYEELIPSAYRVLEGYSYEKDEKLHGFIGDVLSDISMGMNNEGYNDPDSQEAYLDRLNCLAANWYLARYCSEGHGKEAAEKMDYVLNNYPYTGTLIDSEVRRAISEPVAFMDEMAKLMKKTMMKKHEKLRDDELLNVLDGSYRQMLGK